MSSFYSEAELAEIGFKSVGKNVKLSRKASIYSPEEISIGDNVRVDDYCILSGRIRLGSNIHISAYVALYGSLGIEIGDNSGISPRSTVYSAMDDFSGDFLIGPVHPAYERHVTGGPVIIGKYVQIGCNSVVFPNLCIEDGSAIGACSLVNKSTEAWHLYYGIPAEKVKERKRGLLNFVGKD